jgi:glutathione S-transferase
MRARMALLHAGHAFEVFEISLRDKPAAMLALSPKATVPVLRLPSGHVLEESLDIMQWALAAHDDTTAWARSQTPDNLALLHACDHAFKPLLDRYKYPERFGLMPPERDATAAQAMAVLLAPLEARLQHHPHLGGATPCATDWAVLPFVRQFAAVSPAWFAAQPLPAVQAWLAAWLGSALFTRCMRKVPPQQAVRFEPSPA